MLSLIPGREEAMHSKPLAVSTLALLVVLVGVLAIATASAEAKGEFKVLGLASLANGIEVVGEAEGVTKFSVPEYPFPFEVVCQKMTVLEGKLLSAGVADVKFFYEECVPWLLKKEGEELKLKEKIPCETSTATADLYLLAVLHAGKTYLLAEPKNQKETPPVFISFKNEKFFECPLPKDFVMRGTYAFELASGDLQVGPEVVSPLLKAGSKALQGLLEDRLSFGVPEAFIEGSVVLRLIKQHFGCTWGVI